MVQIVIRILLSAVLFAAVSYGIEFTGFRTHSVPFLEQAVFLVFPFLLSATSSELYQRLIIFPVALLANVGIACCLL